MVRRNSTARRFCDESLAIARSDAWREDADKCTFIVLDRELAHDADAPGVEAMVGDVNLCVALSAGSTCGGVLQR